MKIVGMEVTPITLEWKKVIGESFGVVGKREDDVIVQIFADNGLYGLGEAMTLGPYYGRESQGTVTALLAEHIGPKVLLEEDPFNIDLVHYKMDKTVSENSFAKTAVDLALHDIVGKALNIPVCKLIGGSYTDKIALHWPIGIGSP
jgi:L-alanine-DL-glutamate epimerase-like enolase superfamily enzyme